MLPNSLLLILLLSAHCIGDFYLQWPCLAEKKRSVYPWLIVHSLLYAIPVGLVYFVVDIKWPFLLLAAAAHWLIDSGKWFLDRNKKIKPSALFAVDQVLHMICLLTLGIIAPSAALKAPFSLIVEDFWRWLLVFLLIIKPANISFKELFYRFTVLPAPKEGEPNNNGAEILSERKPEESIRGAGSIIGALERIFVVVFAAIGQYTAFGMLMTAKSLARFERLTKEAAFAEYYLIGTLYSVLFAFLAYLIVFKIL